MLLLKVGDKAVVYANTGGHYFELGTVVKIVEVYTFGDTQDHYFAVPENEEFTNGDYYSSGGWWVNDDEVFALKQEEVVDIE